MESAVFKPWVSRQLESAGLTINDGQADPAFNLRVLNERFYTRATLKGSLGFGEAYADGDWECTHLDKIVYRILLSEIGIRGVSDVVLQLRSALCNMQSRLRAMRVAKQHYDVDAALFEQMLDPYMQYTCGYWADARTLDEAQIAKMDLIIRKLGLKAGDRLLDIGSGWGGFAKYAAQVHGIRVSGLSISKPQIEYARIHCAGLDCCFKFGDYRQLPELYPRPFDAISIIGVTEHIGYKNYRKLHEVMRACLKPGRLALEHTITRMQSCRHTDPFIDRYIFPGGMVPSVEQLSRAMNRSFVIEDVHNFSADYDTTLMAWQRNFARHKQEIESSPQLGKKFYRIWEYYLLSCAAMFRARRSQLMQFVLSPEGVPGGYRRVG